tara:strand:+ start:23443 stop:24624 length:1182 start_codon:yes stop_codon:yes gene_type:complete
MVKIHLNQIPSERIYLKLHKKVIDWAINLIRKCNYVLDSKTNEQLYRFKIGKKISIDLVKKIIRILDLENEFVERNIKLITSCKNTNIGVKNPKFPINFTNNEGVRIISAVMGDGEINNQIMVRYNNQNKNLIDSILNCFKQVFGDIDYKIYLREDSTYQLTFPKIVGLILLKTGLKEGYKSLTNYSIPDFIFKLDKRKKAVFIKQFFTDEGNVRLKDRRVQVKQTIRIDSNKKRLRSNPEKYAPESLKGIGALLSDLGIKSILSLGAYRKIEKKADWELSIYGKENLEKFRKKINFYLDYKNKLLEESIKSYKFPSAPRNGRVEFALEKFKITQKKHGYVTKYLLAQKSERSLKTATYFLIDLNKKGFINEIERPRDKKGHPKARKYIIINK